jgi:hypothetical protein
MEIIKKKAFLNKRIKDILEYTVEENIVFPQEFSYCDGVGEPTFVFRIEKQEEDSFVDERGQKWVKSPS